MKKVVTMFLIVALVLSSLTCLLPNEAALAATAEEGYGHAVNGTDVATQYTYEVIPLLEPFNVYFFVKTENPDPKSFRFADHDSIYSGDGEPGLIELYDSISRNRQFVDVVYENPETMRVKGGYIFWSGYADTDGGELTLQTALYDSWGRKTGWQDTEHTLTIPDLCDDIDYLIDTYSKGDGFFENMDAIQAGLSSICLYSDNYIRGNLVRAQSYWYMYRSPHIDQAYYIGSPSSRQENRYLFASSLYPLVRDSLGFPSTMAAVARRLDETAVCEWSSSSHAFIKVTYNGETRTYGGQGNGMGQGISEDKITKFFTFGDDDMGITLDSLKKLHAEYASIVMENDIYHDDELTWKAVNDTVGDGTWVYFTNGYTYLYKKDDKDSYPTMAAGSAGGSLYWGGGSLGYLTNAWIDGRHISRWSMLDPGATFEEYPTDEVALTDAVFPVFTFERSYVYDRETGTYKNQYKNVTVEERTGLLQYTYNAAENTWDASSQYTYNADGTQSATTYALAVELAEQGLIDEKYVEMLRLTYEQVLAMDVDRNTDLDPERGLVYNGNAAPGTPYDSTLLDIEDPSVRFEEAKAIAEENELEFSLDEGYYGICGNPMYWVYLQDSQTLIVTGTGPLFTLDDDTPWEYGRLPIKQVIIGEGVEALPDYAFYACSDLETATLPTTLKKIGWSAFRICTNLQKIEIPASVISVGSNVFGTCYELTDIYCLADAQPEGWMEDWLGNCSATVHWGTAMPCEHKRTTTNRKEATCTEDGYEEIVCNKCGDTLSYKTLSATGHDFGEWKVTQAATCTQDGTEERICSSCGTKETRTVPATGHDFGAWEVTKAATCTEDGTEERVCSSCDAKETRTLPATGHSFGEWTVTKAPTCTEDGTEERVCSVCGAKETRALSATGHDWEDTPTVIPPTCTEDGSTAVHCKNCDETKDFAVLPATGHDWEDTPTVVPPTCTENGSTVTHCKNCDETKDFAILPATGHSFREWQTTKAPTCTEDGTEERVCSVCGEKETRALPATGHDWEDTPTTVPPTCTENGSTATHCRNCGETKDVTILPATGHDFGEWKVTQAATCTEDGTEERVCSSCDAKETRALPATGHDFGEWKVTKAATCTENGTEERVCSSCDAKETRTLPATGHTYEDGVCTVCGASEASLIPGDLNGDGKINAKDYLMLKRYVLGTFSLTEEQKAAADVNKDKRINGADYLLVKRHVLGSFKLR